MKYITAPWREEYVKEASKMKECIFCQAINMKENREAHILYRGEHNGLLVVVLVWVADGIHEGSIRVVVYLVTVP